MKTNEETEPRETNDTDTNLDGCDIAITDEDSTPDEELPAAEGGVA